MSSPETQAGDVGRLAELEAALADKERQLELKEQELASLYASLIHGLDTPLEVHRELIAQLTSGIGGGLSDEQRGYLALIEKHGLRLRACLEGLQEWWGLRMPGASLERDDGSLLQLVHRVTAEFEVEAAMRNIALDVELPPSLAPVRFHAAKLAQALATLVENALHVSPRNAHVVVRVVPSASEVAIDVDDSGPGVPDEDRERIFEPFERPGHGLGLGLALSREYLRLHGGDVELHHRPEGGSRFRLRLPR
ncbi:MAG: HAMP domain-containing sensor histidine kinase [Planctomycetota bacterium]